MNCSICKSDSVQIKSNDFVFPKLYTGFSYLKCDSCGHVIVLPPQSDSLNGQDYIREYTSVSLELKSPILSRVKDIVKKYTLSNKSSIYDIGSGNCQYGMAFSKLGFHSVAVDVERFNPNYSPFVYSCDLDKVLNKDGSYVFFSNHSLEHIDADNLEKLLATISKNLSSKSSCLFIMPSPKRILIKFGIYLEEFVYGHKNLFSEKSAKLYFNNLLNLDGCCLVKVVSPRTRFAFLKTRIALLQDYLKHYYFSKALILMWYIVYSIFFGCKEEIWLRIEKFEK